MLRVFFNGVWTLLLSETCWIDFWLASTKIDFERFFVTSYFSSTGSAVMKNDLLTRDSFSF